MEMKGGAEANELGQYLVKAWDAWGGGVEDCSARGVRCSRRASCRSLKMCHMKFESSFTVKLAMKIWYLVLLKVIPVHLISISRLVQG
jgi:hypothetical protein